MGHVTTTSSRLVAGLRSARPVPGRWPVGVVALVGVALTVPSIVGPTWLQTVSDRQRGELLSQEWQWSWGRVDLNGITGVELSLVPNPLGLAMAVALLVLGAAAVAVWVIAPGPFALLAPVAVALLAGRLLTTAAERHGRDFRELIGSEAGLNVTNGSTTAGWLETAAAAVLVVGLVLMVVALAKGSALRSPAEAPAGVDEEPAVRHTGTVGSRAGLRPKGSHLEGPEVDFRDEGPR